MLPMKDSIRHIHVRVKLDEWEELHREAVARRQSMPAYLLWCALNRGRDADVRS